MSEAKRLAAETKRLADGYMLAPSQRRSLCVAIDELAALAEAEHAPQETPMADDPKEKKEGGSAQPLERSRFAPLKAAIDEYLKAERFLGRSLENSTLFTEEEKAMKDAVLTGSNWMRNGKRIDPKEVFLDPPPPIDYRALLVKYMNHISEMEGTSFLGRSAEGGQFTPQELAELRYLYKEA